MRWTSATLAVISLALPSATALGGIERSYFIGNSLTQGVVVPWSVTYGLPTPSESPLSHFAQSNGNDSVIGYHVNGGSGLSEIRDSFTADGRADLVSHGPYTLGLAQNVWDQVVVEPWKASVNSELAALDSILTSQPAGSSTPLYVYATWPARVNADGDFDSAAPLDFLKAWKAPLASDDTRVGYSPRKAYFDRFLERTREAFPDRDVNMIPVGGVMAELQERIDAGTAVELDSILELYNDWTHQNNIGEYLGALTHYATLYDADPRGMAVPAGYQEFVSPALAAEIQSAVYSVVFSNPSLTGVPEPTTAALAAAGVSLLLRRRRRD